MDMMITEELTIDGEVHLFHVAEKDITVKQGEEFPAGGAIFVGFSFIHFDFRLLEPTNFNLKLFQFISH